MRVLVTGANGHLGFNLVAGLLGAGHTVRAGVRSIANAVTTSRLRALGNVEVVDAELSRPNQLRAAMDGVELLFHAAAVYSIALGRTAEMQDASVRGAQMVLGAAADARVRKVVLTSSAITLPMVPPGAPPVDETRWTEDLRVPYFRAKTEGERAAWKTAGELGLNLVTLLPGSITGPGFGRNTPTIDLIEAMMRNALRLCVPAMNLQVVDVRDAVAAHLLAGERDCHGRFLVCNDTAPTFRTMLEIMHGIDRRIAVPRLTMPDFLLPSLPLLDRLGHLMLGTPLTASAEMLATVRGKIWNPSNQRIKDVLGWRPTITLEQTLRDTMTTLRSLGSVS